MHRIFVTLIFIFSVTCCFSQRYSSYIKFDSKQKDIGTIHEEKGVVKVEYKFTNTGTKPLIINQVKTPTIRIKAEWIKKPILPKKSGIITVFYNPQREKGSFSRTLTILSNAKNNITIIKIRGNVIPRPLTLEEQFPMVHDQLRFRKEGPRLYFNNIKNTEKKSDTLYFINYSDNNVTITFKEEPKFISLSCVPQVLKPKQRGKIIVEFDARKTKAYGHSYERIPLGINGNYDFKNEIAINALIDEDFSKLTEEQINNGPKVKFTHTKYNFGNLEHGKNITHKYFFQNIGKSDLIVRKIKAGCGCTPYMANKRYIKPGEKSFIEVTFKSKGRRGRQHKFITFITNDPVNPTIKLEIMGNITRNRK